MSAERGEPNWISLLTALNYDDLPSRVRGDVTQGEFVALVMEAIQDFHAARRTEPSKHGDPGEKYPSESQSGGATGESPGRKHPDSGARPGGRRE